MLVNLTRLTERAPVAADDDDCPLDLIERDASDATLDVVAMFRWLFDRED